MHQSFVTTAPSGGDSRANVLCFYFCIVPIVREEMSGNCYTFVHVPRQTCMRVQCKNMTECGGELPGFYQLAVPAVWDFSRIARQKVKVPAVPPDWRPWLQMTSPFIVKQRLTFNKKYL